MKTKVLLLITLCATLFLFTGCGKKENELIGKWEGHTNEVEESLQMKASFEFESEGKVTYINDYGSNVVGSYKIVDNTVTIEVSSWDKPKEYKFKIEDGKLDLIAQDNSQSYVGLEKK
jgi:hypothetical protein